MAAEHLRGEEDRMPSTFIIVGRACSGKSTLAAWLCRRLPQPVAGLRTLCTGRDEAGALFSLQDLATGQLTPLGKEETTNPWNETGAAILQAALQSEAATILVDEAAPPRAQTPAWNEALAALLHSDRTVVLTVAKENLAAVRQLAAGREEISLDLDETAPEELRAALAQTLPPPLHVGVSVRLFREEKCFGSGPMQLLELVGRTGSLHQAAAAMGMAYSKAWKMLGELERQWNFPMLERRPGGTGGGGSLLTPRAWDLLRRYHALQWETEHAARQSFARWFGDL